MRGEVCGVGGNTADRYSNGPRPVVFGVESAPTDLIVENAPVSLMPPRYVSELLKLVVAADETAAPLSLRSAQTVHDLVYIWRWGRGELEAIWQTSDPELYSRRPQNPPVPPHVRRSIDLCGRCKADRPLSTQIRSIAAGEAGNESRRRQTPNSGRSMLPKEWPWFSSLAVFDITLDLSDNFFVRESLGRFLNQARHVSRYHRQSISDISHLSPRNSGLSRSNKRPEDRLPKPLIERLGRLEKYHQGL